MEEVEFDPENLEGLPESSDRLLCQQLQLPRPLPVQLGWAAPEPRRLFWEPVPQLHPSCVELQPGGPQSTKRTFLPSQGSLLAADEDGSLLAPALENAYELARYQIWADDRGVYQVKVQNTALQLPEPLLEVRAWGGCQALRSDHYVLIGRSLEAKHEARLPELTRGLCLSPHICGEFATLHPNGIRVWDVRRGVPKAWRRRARARVSSTASSSSSSGWSGSSSDNDLWEEELRPPDLGVMGREMEAFTWWRHPDQLVAAGEGALLLHDLRGRSSSILFDRHLPLQGLPLYLQLTALERHPCAEHQLLAVASGPAQVLLLDVRRPEQPVLRWPLPDPHRRGRYVRIDQSIGYRALAVHGPLPQQTQAWMATACLGGRYTSVLAWESSEAPQGGRLPSPEGGEAADVGLLRVRPRPGTLHEETAEHGALLGCVLQALPGRSAPALFSLTERGDLGLLLLDGPGRQPERSAPKPAGPIVASPEPAPEALDLIEGGPAPVVDVTPKGIKRAVWWLRRAPAQVASALAAVGLLEEEGGGGEQPGAFDVLLAQRRALQGLWERMPEVLHRKPSGRRVLMGPFLQGAASCASSSVAGGQSSDEPLLPVIDQETRFGEDRNSHSGLSQEEEELAARAEADARKGRKLKEPEDLAVRLLQGYRPEPLPDADFAEAYSHRLTTVLPLLCIGQPAQGWRPAPPPPSPLQQRQSLLELASVAYAREGGPSVEPATVVLGIRLVMRSLAACGLLKCASAWTNVVEPCQGGFFKNGLEAYMPIPAPRAAAPAATEAERGGVRLTDRLRRSFREQVAAEASAAEETRNPAAAKVGEKQEREPLADAVSQGTKPKRQRHSGF